ncbi:MAG: methylated-DNA--[protein]-cysteine S-methyltransferase [Alphaproteobacteria bacterium]|jgi:AraC family transcriptional regulator of adaptative response/methylated-DNA-[protein]-cysteine methyltransferase|nr:methylated-DNA--[protein]-cysteine S-methyltransferase [Alphaproteobacteria bacterium]
MEQSYHYKLIARAIALIDAPGGTARSLDDLAADLGLSPAHFQRVFSAWAGVSPKRYQQYLTLGHARRLLDARFTTFDAALQLGLSGQARLHDLFLRWEGMTPGDYAKRGEGLTIRHGWFDSPFGPALGLATERGLCGLAFADDPDDATLADMTRRWPNARYINDPGAAAPHLEAAFARKGTARLHMMGTPFQIKVWEALLQVPTGHVTSYGEVARTVCSQRAARAVGAAVGRNPLGFVIPCHRVLQGNGALGGYHWGLPRKRAMLGWEAARRDVVAQA